MIIRKLDNIIKNHYASSNNALYLYGARQVGKSYAIRNYAQANYPIYIELNFYQDTALRTLVATASNVEQLLERIALHAHTTLEPGKTFIFFDEVQKCPEVITKIKFLVEEGSCRYALSGSMLGIELDGKKKVDSWPVGYMSEQHVFPLDFEEFIRAVGVGDKIISGLQSCWERKLPIDDSIHEEMMKLFHLYLITGGMPAPVQTYLDTHDFVQVEARQKEILALYRKDIQDYNPGRELVVNEIFDLIPPELNAMNKRFVLKDMHDKARYRQYANDFLWLTKAEMALPAFNAEIPVSPLILNEKRNLFKLFQNDVGLLASQYASGIQLKLLQGYTDIHYGAIYENVVAQELHAHGFNLFYFNSKNQGELDFLLEQDAVVTPLEVKSGKTYDRHNAMRNVLSNAEYHITDGLVLCNDNLHIKENVTYAPIYMLMFLHAKERAPQALHAFVLPEFMK